LENTDFKVQLSNCLHVRVFSVRLFAPPCVDMSVCPSVCMDEDAWLSLHGDIYTFWLKITKKLKRNCLILNVLSRMEFETQLFVQSAHILLYVWFCRRFFAFAWYTKPWRYFN